MMCGIRVPEFHSLLSNMLQHLALCLGLSAYCAISCLRVKKSQLVILSWESMLGVQRGTNQESKQNIYTAYINIKVPSPAVLLAHHAASQCCRQSVGALLFRSLPLLQSTGLLCASNGSCQHKNTLPSDMGCVCVCGWLWSTCDCANGWIPFLV